jgi:hypothetical protein
VTVKVEVKEVVRKTEERTVTAITCDICGKVQERPDVDDYARYQCTNWTSDSYTINTVSVSCAHGSSFPEGTTSEVTALDICPECFHEHIVPLAKGKHRHYSSDW